MSETGLTLSEPRDIMIDPKEVLESASSAAKALKGVIDNKPKKVIINDEQYIEFDDWQTVGQFYGYTVKTHEAVPVEIDGIKGAKAQADLVDFRSGLVVGGAEGYCMRDEEKWGTRPKYEWQGEGDNRKRVKIIDEPVPWFQLASMAQTRAGSKAFRNRLAWVVVLAGYRTTPAEEMTDDTISTAVKERRTVDKSEHYCSIHDTNWFKKGRMKGYAHPNEDGTWCNEEEAGNSPEDSKNESPIDLDWLKASLTRLQEAGQESWSNKNILSYLSTMSGKQAKSVSEAVSYLSEKQAIDFYAEVNQALSMIYPDLTES